MNLRRESPSYLYFFFRESVLLTLRVFLDSLVGLVTDRNADEFYDEVIGRLVISQYDERDVLLISFFLYSKFRINSKTIVSTISIVRRAENTCAWKLRGKTLDFRPPDTAESLSVATTLVRLHQQRQVKQADSQSFS